MLNLNDNKLEYLPDSIGELYGLTHLSLHRNQLQALPRSIGKLRSLRELNLGDNCLQFLPYELGDLRLLQKLAIYRNKLEQVPYTIGSCTSLTVLDLAINRLMLLPSQLSKCERLKELYAEHNPLLREVPVNAVPVKEVLVLKELSLRVLLNSPSRPLSPESSSFLNSSLTEALIYAEKCSVCHKYFYFTYIECVRFIKSKKISPSSSVPNLPLRTALCSVDCFVDTGGRGMFGIINV